MQFPVNWMGVPWSFKKYMDEVYTAGMDGRLCEGDGRSSSAPKANYGMGGRLGHTRYMLSATFNAPREAFDNPQEPFFQGGSVDQLLEPMHLNMRFFGARPMPTFSVHDVMKDPQVEADLRRYREHLSTHFADSAEAAA
jgi:modulator of drug activity B